MINLDQFKKRIEALPKAIEEQSKQILEPATDYVVAIQRARLEVGKTYKGKKIKYNKKRVNTPASEPYTMQYVRYKKKRGGETNFVDLHLNGNFYSTLEAMPDDMAFIVEAADTDQGKVRGIFKNYDDIIGISEKETLPLIDILRRPLIDAVQRNLIER